jgi:hypothetical protein
MQKFIFLILNNMKVHKLSSENPKLRYFNAITPSILHIIFSIVTRDVVRYFIEGLSKSIGINVVHLNIMIMFLTLISIWSMNRVDVIGTVDEQDKSTGNKRKIKQIGIGILGMTFWIALWPLIDQFIQDTLKKYNFNPILYYGAIIFMCIFGLSKFEELDVML